MRRTFSLPVFSCLSANAEVAQVGFSSASHFWSLGMIHRYPLSHASFHHRALHVHLWKINLSSQEACTDQNQRASCDHFGLTEDCLVLYLWKQNKFKNYIKLRWCMISAAADKFCPCMLASMFIIGKNQPVNIVMLMNRFYCQNTLSNIKSGNSFSQSLLSYEQSHHVSTR